MRDEFSNKIKDILARRVAFRCSNPSCLKITSGPHLLNDGTINIGVAAHIEAASPGGKRFNKNQSGEQRSGVENGIWLCQNCAKLVDSDELTYTVKVLKQWKEHTEQLTLNDVINFNRNSLYTHSELIERKIADIKSFHKPNLVLHGKLLCTKDVIAAKFRNTGYKAKNIFVVVSLYNYPIKKIIVNKQEILETDEAVSVTIVGDLPFMTIVDGLINFSYEDIDGRRYQQFFTFNKGITEITPPEMLGNA